jgi:hypothetical protein
MTLGELLKEKERLEGKEIHNFAKWREQIAELEIEAANGDAASTQTLLQIAVFATDALKRVVDTGSAPVRCLVAISDFWPVIVHACPHVEKVRPPPNLGANSEYPFDWKRVYKRLTPARMVTIELLLLIFYVRQLQQKERLIRLRIVSGRFKMYHFGSIQSVPPLGG